eukprot:COSAG06_NODE_42256_length_383_cov_1.077465_1_plen_33_part_10
MWAPVMLHHRVALAAALAVAVRAQVVINEVLAN